MKGFASCSRRNTFSADLERDVKGFFILIYNLPESNKIQSFKAKELWLRWNSSFRVFLDPFDLCSSRSMIRDRFIQREKIASIPFFLVQKAADSVDCRVEPGLEEEGVFVHCVFDDQAGSVREADDCDLVPEGMGHRKIAGDAEPLEISGLKFDI